MTLIWKIKKEHARRTYYTGQMSKSIMKYNTDHNNENMPIVSIIIPVFNREQFIGNLLRSVARQSFADFEVIVVDDGSTDSTFETVNQFCKTDERFFCITKENGGAGSARNAGLDMAQGRYVMFLDSDDQYHKDLLKELVETAEKYQADEVFCLYDEYNYKTRIHRRAIGYDSDCFPQNEPVKPADVSKLYQHMSWRATNTLFRKEIIDRHDLRFSTTHVANDVFFMYAFASVAESFVGIPRSLLTVRVHFDEQSLTSTRWLHLQDTVFVLIELYDWLNEKGIYDKYKETYLLLFIFSLKKNAQYPLNPEFVDAVTEALCAKELFQWLDEEEFYNKYWKILETNVLERQIKELYTEECSSGVEVQNCCNSLLTIRSIEEQAREKYGRLLNPSYPTISIIVPVYQTERYLRACIDSVLSQSFSDFELLLIDDGSRDESGAICDQYAEKDTRIRVFHQKNQGQSVAQNLGIRKAKGKYITIIDSDDMLLSNDYLQILLDAAVDREAQISVCKTVMFNEGSPIPYTVDTSHEVSCITGPEFCYMQRNAEGYAFNSSCSKLYERTLFSNVSYPPGRLSQDIAIAHRLAYPCDRIALVSAPLYGYRLWDGSTSVSSPYEKILGDMVFAFQERIHYFRELKEAQLAEDAEQLMLLYLAHKKKILRNREK